MATVNGSVRVRLPALNPPRQQLQAVEQLKNTVPPSRAALRRLRVTLGTRSGRATSLLWHQGAQAGPAIKRCFPASNNHTTILPSDKKHHNSQLLAHPRTRILEK